MLIAADSLTLVIGRWEEEIGRDWGNGWRNVAYDIADGKLSLRPACVMQVRRSQAGAWERGNMFCGGRSAGGVVGC